MARRALFVVALLGLWSAVGATPAQAQIFLQNSAETIDKGTFKLGGYPVGLFGENGADDSWGAVFRAGYGFTPSFDAELSVGVFSDFTLVGFDAEYWAVKGDIDLSIGGGLHKAFVDEGQGFDSTAFDLFAIASGRVARNLDLYGGFSMSFESLSDYEGADGDFTRAYLVPGLEYRLAPNVDVVLEGGIGLNDDSPNYLTAGLAFYIR
jgi:hypothetical protein